MPIKNGMRLAELNATVGGERPRYFRTASFAKLKQERFWLHRFAEDHAPVVPLHQQHLLTASWMAQPPLRHGAPFDEGLPVTAAGPDVLVSLGASLFSGPTLKARIEQDLGERAIAARAALAGRSSRVSGLQVRRALGGLGPIDVPVLDEARVTAKLVRAGKQVSEARLVIPFRGDRTLFEAALPEPAPELFPVARITRNTLVIGARFSKGNAPFAPALMQCELALVRAGLDRQREAATVAQARYAGWVKRIVAELLAGSQRGDLGLQTGLGINPASRDGD